MVHSPQGDPSQKPHQPTFQCDICQQRYRRPDHLARHARSHSSHKPYQCHLCGKSFSRSDLLRRHVASHTGPDGKLKGPPRNGAHPTSRVGQACQACSANHLRCTDSKPCKRCCDKGIECVWDQSAYGQQRPRSFLGDVDTEMEDDQTLATADLDHRQQYSRQMGQLSPESGPRVREGIVDSHEFGASTDPYRLEADPNPSANDAGTITSLLTNSALDGFSIQESIPRLPEWNFLPGQWQSPEHAGSALDPFFPILGFDDGDMRFLDVYNQSIPFELGPKPPSQWFNPATEVHMDESPRHLAASGSEAFRQHYWRFRPDALRDHAGADEHNLSLPQTANDGSSPESRISVGARITAAPLTMYTRDAILALVVKHCRSANLSRIFASFPSVELLDKLCQHYMTSPVAKPDTFLHVPSFDPKDKKPELILAMIAAGAVLTYDSTLMKFGYAMHEIIRHAIGAQWEGNNAMTRNLELLQAFLIQLEVGLYSGHGRKIEITESFLSVPLTILRRAGKFKKNEYSSTPPLAENMAGDELQKVWETWLQKESWKRLAFRLVNHDTNSSMCLIVNPVVSYAEITLPLPCSAPLWMASNAGQWVRARLETGSGESDIPQPQCIMDFMDDPGMFSSHGSRRPQFDTPLAGQALISCAWALAWECVQIRVFSRSRPRRWSSLILSSRQEEITKLIHNFRISMEDKGTESDYLKLKLEHVLLHLHAPLDEIQVFAGMEGPDQAQAMHQTIKEWADSQPARKAICHAGSIVRLVQRIPRGLVAGPLAFIMFHASIVLWAFALVQADSTNTTSSSSSSSERQSQDAATVWLDEEFETITLQRFVQLGTGQPYLGGVVDGSRERSVAVSLQEPQKLLGALVDIFSLSYRGQPVSHLVDKMISLMRGLQASP